MGRGETNMNDVPAPGSPARPGAQRRAEACRMRILVVDDHEIIRWGFRLLMTAESWVQRYLQAENSTEALELTRRYEPHVAVIDLLLGGESGSELCGRVREISPGTNVLLMSGAGRITARSAREAGALGFVPKDWGAKDLAGAARMVGLGMSVFVPSAAAVPSVLSGREDEVLHLIAEGKTNGEIAAELFLSPHTVKDHTRALYKKINAKNRCEAIARAQRIGLLG